MLQQSVMGAWDMLQQEGATGWLKGCSPLKKQGCQVIAKENVKFLSSLSVLWELFSLFPTI